MGWVLRGIREAAIECRTALYKHHKVRIINKLPDRIKDRECRINKGGSTSTRGLPPRVDPQYSTLAILSGHDVVTVVTFQASIAGSPDCQ